MLVKDRMSKEPVTIAPDSSVDEALNLMREKGVRHLPVLEDGVVVGVVNDIELRTAWFPSLLDELHVKDVMATEFLTVAPTDSVFQAARLLYHHKLTGLLVSDNGKLVGIITLADILALFVEFLGLLGEGYRVDVALDPRTQSLDQVNSIISLHGAETVSISLVRANESRRVYSLRLDGGDCGEINQELAQAGFEILG